MQADLLHLCSESDSVFRLTPVCPAVFLVMRLLTALVFVLHPDSLMVRVSSQLQL